MPIIKLSRINKGGTIFINSDEILFIEMEYRATTIHMAHNLLFSVEESPDGIAEQIEMLAAARITRGLNGNTPSVVPPAAS